MEWTIEAALAEAFTLGGAAHQASSDDDKRRTADCYADLLHRALATFAPDRMPADLAERPMVFAQTWTIGATV